MGAPMARNLIKAGHALNLFDLNQTVLKELAELGGTISASPRAAAEGADTIDPQTARDVAAAAAKQGVVMADAPVSGGTGGAQAGTLTFMVGATPQLFATLQPVLAQMG
eukprot:gene23329-27753_t